MKIGLIGAGKLGICLALNFENKGNHVYVCESSEQRIKDIQSGTLNTLEPNVNDLLKSNTISFYSLHETILNSDLVFITVRTEGNPDGSYDCSQVFDLFTKISNLEVESETILLLNCNVNPGTVAVCQKMLDPKFFTVAYSPEWVAQGSIIDNQLNPDVVVVGHHNEDIQRSIIDAYKLYIENMPTPICMSAQAAEATKILLNSYLTIKITFANFAGDLLKKLGEDPDVVLRALGADKRIGNKYLNYGFGYGGPCFPRDINALLALCRKFDHPESLPVSIIEYNDFHRDEFANYLASISADNVVDLDSISYKPGIDLFDYSEQLATALLLIERGYSIKIKSSTKGQKDYISRYYPQHLHSFSFNL